MAAAITLGGRARAVSAPNPNVGCVLVQADRVVGRGWTQAGGRPHAEAMALEQAGIEAKGATAYVTLEPCAHESPRGPSCADILVAAGVARVVIAMVDPDPRTLGKGIERLRSAGISVAENVLEGAARRNMAGWLKQQSNHRPFITLKLATSLDGCIARADGESKWITGAAARAHGHLERARSNMILVGRGTYVADRPKLDVRLDGLQDRSPARAVLTHGPAPTGWTALASPAEVSALQRLHYLMVEGGAQTASAFLAAGLVDRLMLYRAPILIGRGRASLGDIGLDALSDAHGVWQRTDTRTLGIDTLEVYERA